MTEGALGEEVGSGASALSEVLAKAGCVIVLPGVKKVGLSVGGSTRSRRNELALGREIREVPAVYSIGWHKCRPARGCVVHRFRPLWLLIKKGADAILAHETKLGGHATPQRDRAGFVCCRAAFAGLPLCGPESLRIDCGTGAMKGHMQNGKVCLNRG